MQSGRESGVKGKMDRISHEKQKLRVSQTIQI